MEYSACAGRVPGLPQKACFCILSLMDVPENPRSELRDPKSTDDLPPFDWRVFADATCAGLAALIPLPFVDMIFEALFRRRIPGTIARARRLSVAPEVKGQLGRGVDRPMSLQGCLSLIVKAVLYVIKKIWRKIIYILAVKDSVASISRYWHRAFLIDHMLRAGHLDPAVDTELAVRVFRQTVRAIDPGPLTGLARLTVANAHHVLRLLVDARRLGAAEVTRSLGGILGSHWRVADASLKETAAHYNAGYSAELERRAQASPAAASSTMTR